MIHNSRQIQISYRKFIDSNFIQIGPHQDKIELLKIRIKEVYRMQ